MKLMSVSHTEQAVIDRTKTETRRLGWWEDKNGRRLLDVGDRLQLCRKVMGRRKGEPLVRLAVVEVTGIRRERLDAITDEAIRAEGVPLDAGAGGFDEVDSDTGRPTVAAWVLWFCRSMGCRPGQLVTVIEWRYLDEAAS